MNETTILEKQPLSNGQQETKKEGSAWKQVTLGGVSGILMGAGLLYAGQAAAQELGKEETPEEGKTEDVVAPEPGETSHTLENGLKVAAVNDDLSFGEAFAQARAEVGPGGVFHWHGGIYNTYSADEWNAMTVEQKHDFAQQVQPEIRSRWGIFRSTSCWASSAAWARSISCGRRCSWRTRSGSSAVPICAGRFAPGRWAC